MGDTIEQSKDVIGEKKQSGPGNKAPKQASKSSATLSEADSETSRQKQDTSKEYAKLVQELIASCIEDGDDDVRAWLLEDKSRNLPQNLEQPEPKNQEAPMESKE